jgi:ABC-type multidrug transport system permease subunit
MTTLLYIIGFPLIVIMIAMLFKKIIYYFSPNEEERKKAPKDYNNLEIMATKYMDFIFGYAWKIIKYGAILAAVIFLFSIISNSF